MDVAPTTIIVDGVTLDLVVHRKRVRHINARLRQNELSVSAPAHVSQDELNRIIPDLARKLLRRAHARRVNADEDALALAKQIAARFPVPPQVAHVEFVTTQVARWGSYSSATRTIRLNAVLKEMPRWVLEAVVAHELAHVFHLNHGPEFWALVRKVYPETDRADGFLAGVTWLTQHNLSPVARSLLNGCGTCLDAPTSDVAKPPSELS